VSGFRFTSRTWAQTLHSTHQATDVPYFKQGFLKDIFSDVNDFLRMDYNDSTHLRRFVGKILLGVLFLNLGRNF
jgi:hypothetical protein